MSDIPKRILDNAFGYLQGLPMKMQTKQKAMEALWWALEKDQAESTDSKIMSEGFDHPCRETCSGWKQGRLRGLLEAKHFARTE